MGIRIAYEAGDVDAVVVVENSVTELDSVRDALGALVFNNVEIYIKYVSPCIGSIELEHDIIQCLSNVRMSNFVFDGVEWNLASWMYFFTCVKDHPNMQSIIFRKYHAPMDVLASFLPNLLLDAVEFSYCDFSELDIKVLFSCLPDCLRELNLSWCNMPSGGLVRGVGYLRDVNKNGIQTISFIGEYEMVGVEFVDVWLDSCKNIREVILHEGFVVSGIIDRLCSPSVFVHPSMRNFMFSGWGYQESLLRQLHAWVDDIRRLDARRIMSFLNRRIRRIAAKSAIRKLFPEADRLVWECLVSN